MTDEELAEIAARADAAAVGPWHSSKHDDFYGIVRDGQRPRCIAVLSNLATEMSQLALDAEFIAHARDDVPKLVAEVQRLREECERLESLLAKYDKY